MANRLDVDAGETHNVYGGEVEEWSGTTVDGTLDVDGTLRLVDDPETPDQPVDVATDGIDLPIGSINLRNMQMGVAMFLVGIIATLGGLATVARNYLAVSVLMIAVVSLIVAGVLGTGLEVFWMLIIATVVLIAAGFGLKWM